MLDLGLLCGHLVGDYIFQDDWQAANKTKNSLTCLVHCYLYTLAILAFCWSLPWWFYLSVGVIHFPIDRFRLARKLMSYRHEAFASGAFAPWSIIVVDNTLHLVTLFWLAQLTDLTKF